MGLFSFFVRPKLPEATDYLFPVPSVQENINRLSWKAVGSQFDLHVSGTASGVEIYRIDPSEFLKADSTGLRDDIAGMTLRSFDVFREAMQARPDHQRFRDWWMQKASQSGQLFQYDFSEGPWNIPWEMLLGMLLLSEIRPETAFVRCVGSPKDTCDSLPTKSLRTLIIKANAQNLNLDAEINNILSAWEGLEYWLREAVAKPVVVTASSQAVIDALREVKPNLLWFSGHGSHEGVVRLHFSENEVVTAYDFANMFSEAGHCPEFTVFWACDTASGPAKVETRHPELFVALREKGVAAMVGMQSPVHDFAAIAMAAHLFRGVGQGLPIEWAMARARTWLYQRDIEQLTMDWAAPVVWSARRPVAHLDWDQVQRFRLQMQLLGTISIDEGQKGADVANEPPDPDSRRRAEDWLPFRATIVRGDPLSIEHRLWFLRTLKGIQTISRTPVLLVDPKRERFSQNALRQWAKGLLDVLQLEKGRLPEEFFVRMDILREDAEIGWRRICSLPNLFLAILDPPAASESWFWDPLFGRTEPIAVLTSAEIPERYRDFPANHAVAGNEVDRARIDRALGKYPRLLVALCSLNIPVKVGLLEQVKVGKEARDLFSSYADLFISSFGGYVICAQARAIILDSANPDSIQQARADCLDLTAKMSLQQKPYLLEQRIDLLLELGEQDGAVSELSDLLYIFRTGRQSASVIRTAEKYVSLRRGLTAWEQLQVAATYLQLGNQAMAELWLRCDASEPLDAILKLMLMAESTKNRGRIDLARNLIDQAMREYEELQKNDSLEDSYKAKALGDALECRHERARLIQWEERNYVVAAQEYEAVISTIEDRVSPERRGDYQGLLAVSHRNLGECILAIEEGDVQNRWRDAESHFQSALSLEKQIHPFSNVIAETEFQLSKLATQRNQPDDARELLNRCIESAEECQHGLMAAIAKNRLFWLDFYRENPEWGAVAEEWSLVADHLRAHKRHSWALRTLITSNIRASKELIRLGNGDQAHLHLLENVSLLRENPAVRRGSDLDRIILTLAGLQLTASTAEPDNGYWSLLDSEFAVAQTRARETGSINPDKAWEGNI